MGYGTEIQYAEASLNFWVGCEPVSESCEHCFAKRYWKRMGLKPGERRRVSDKTIRATLRKCKPGDFVFVNDLSDFFDPKVLDGWRHEALTLMQARRDLVFLLLTKRPEVMAHYLAGSNRWCAEECDHIWLGVTAETEEHYMKRVGILQCIDWPGKRFVSLEPLLGAVDADFSDSGLALGECDECGHRSANPACEACMGIAGIDWLIVGGESGAGARPMNPKWARLLRDQAVAAGVPFFFKQWGEWCPEAVANTREAAKSAVYLSPDGEMRPAARGTRRGATTMQRVGKARAGRLLDGKLWNERPEA